MAAVTIFSGFGAPQNKFCHCFHCFPIYLPSSSPVTTAEFSKFAGILNDALSQHYLLGFEIAPLEFHHLH